MFLEETCLATRPGMPFEELKARLMRRCDTLGIKITKIIEEEWSHIPLGGPLPKVQRRRSFSFSFHRPRASLRGLLPHALPVHRHFLFPNGQAHPISPNILTHTSMCVCVRVRGAQGKQAHFGFGAAANLVHPATGYSILRSLSEAPTVADTIVAGLREQQQQQQQEAAASVEMKTSATVAEAAWGTLWSDERRRQSSFQVRFAKEGVERYGGFVNGCLHSRRVDVKCWQSEPHQPCLWPN